jgi:ubiquinone/menaquinone biosynthesis C-methylase UbiE
MPNAVFRAMSIMMDVQDFLFPAQIEKRVKNFGIADGMTVVDYGCGTGRYTVCFSKLVHEKGQVYAVDIHELAISAVKKRIEKQRIRNVKTILANGYHTEIPERIAHRVAAIDMFFLVPHAAPFLEEIHRITKEDGLLIIDDGHQSRKKTKERIGLSNLWQIVEETPDHLKCRPKSASGK